MCKDYRYTVHILFNPPTGYLSRNTGNISEPVKSRKEAKALREMVDETVKRAYLVDRVTSKVVETWK